jgi:hypothetical protein
MPELTKDIQLYCNVDEEGNIIEVLTGPSIVPTKEFHEFFMIDKQQELNLSKYKVEDRKLVQIEGTTLIGLGDQKLSVEEELALLKKELAEMKAAQNQTPTPTTDTTTTEPPAGETTGQTEEPTTETA